MIEAGFIGMVFTYLLRFRINGYFFKPSFTGKRFRHFRIYEYTFSEIFSGFMGGTLTD